MVLWHIMGLTANLGSGDGMLIPIVVKSQMAKQAVDVLETKRTSRDRFQFIVDSFNKTTVSSLVKIVGNFAQVVAKGLEKLVEARERSRFYVEIVRRYLESRTDLGLSPSLANIINVTYLTEKVFS